MPATTMSRRSFVAAGATGLAVAGLATRALAEETAEEVAESGSAQDESSDWREAPAAIADDQIAEEKSADVIVVGMGHAGTAVARAVAEAGKTVIGIEAQEEDGYSIFGRDFGHINSQFLADAGVPEVDVVEFYNNWMMNTGNRANGDLVMTFAKKSGEAFDWFIDFFDDEVRQSTAISYWPKGEYMFDQLNTGQRFYVGCAQPNFGDRYPDLHAAIKGYDGCSIDYATTAEQLVVGDDGVVTGVIAKASDGSYVRYAGSAVVLAAGDFGGNEAMCRELLTPQFEFLNDDEVERFAAGMSRDGSGIRMGMWAGGRLEPKPMAVMGDFDSFVPTKYSALWLDQDGKRYCNEFFGDGVTTGFQNIQHKHGRRYVIGDKDLVLVASHNISGHSMFDPNEENVASFQEILDTAYAAGAEGYAGGTPGSSSGSNDCWFAADDLDTALTYAGMDDATKATALESVEHYNELCASGADTDYGKDPAVLAAIENGPFYVYVSTMLEEFTPSMLVTCGGLETNGDQQVLDEARDPIPGLYATGNCCGRRFGPEYTTPIPGVSVGMAVTLGMVLGQHLAAA